MTIIVYRDGVMAADSLRMSSAARIGHVRKIVRSPAGHLAGAAGVARLTERFRTWVLAGAEGEPNLGATESFVGILVYPCGKAAHVQADGTITPLDAPYHTVGAGEDFALGALYMGASAEEAVSAAIELCIECGGPIQVERLNDG